MTLTAQLDPAEALLLECFDPVGFETVQVIEGGAGRLAEAIAARVGRVVSLTRDVRLHEAAQKLLAPLPQAEASDAVFPLANIDTDTILMVIPKGRYLSRALLTAAYGALKPGGVLLLAGPSKLGGKSVIADARRLFGNAEVLGYKKHQRIARCERVDPPGPAPEWAREPGVAPETYGEWDVQVDGQSLVIATRPGVFAWNGLDDGTALLLEHLDFEPGQTVWDVGCGAGAIGLNLAQRQAAHVYMSDIDLLALACARRNAEANGVADLTTIFPCDALDQPREPVDLVITNPAFHKGRDQDTDMAEKIAAEAKHALKPGGRVVVVANRFLNYGQLLQRGGLSVDTLVETARFRVWQGR
jgi:16S rRNA (guanine1207-N2)-methyltransferase